MPIEWEIGYYDGRVEVMRYFGDDRTDQQVRLRDAVSRAFDARQSVQRAEVERLRRELTEIETAIQERERQRERIIDRRVQELMRTETSRQPPTSQEQSSVYGLGTAPDWHRNAALMSNAIVNISSILGATS